MPDVVVWGAGAIGGTIGAFLARAGAQVLFVDADLANVRAIAERGLRIDGPIAQFTVAAPAVTPSEISGQHRLILLAVKAHHTTAATRQAGAALAPDGMVVSCQNGLNEEEIAQIVGPGRTMGAFVNFMADVEDPGRIAYGGRGAFVVGELDGRRSPRLEALQSLIARFDPDVRATNDIAGYLWGKAAYGTVLKASALADRSIVGFLEEPAWRAGIIAMIASVVQVAVAAGIRPRGFDGFEPMPFLDPAAPANRGRIEASLEALIGYNRAAAKTHSGVWRDLVVRRRPTDVAAQLRPVLATARRVGIEVPIIAGLIDAVTAVETGRVQIGATLFESLLRSGETCVA